MASKIRVKSSRWSGSSAVQRGVVLLLGLGDDEVLDELAAVAEEHVLGPAQSDPLRAEPAGAGGVLGVSALARTPSRRARSACSISRATARTVSSSAEVSPSVVPSES